MREKKVCFYQNRKEFKKKYFLDIWKLEQNIKVQFRKFKMKFKQFVQIFPLKRHLVSFIFIVKKRRKKMNLVNWFLII